MRRWRFVLEVRDLWPESIATVGLSIALIDRGRLAEAVRALGKQYEIANEIGDMRGVMLSRFNLGPLEATLGRFDRAVRYTDEALGRGIGAYRAAGGRRVMMRADAVVAASADEAARRASDLVGGGYRGMTIEQLLVGDPDQILGRAATLGELGVDQVVIRCAAKEQEHALETLETIGGLSN